MEDDLQERKKGNKKGQDRGQDNVSGKDGRTYSSPHNGRTKRPFPGDRLSPRRRSIAKEGLEALLASWLNFPESGIFSHRAENVPPLMAEFPRFGEIQPRGGKTKISDKGTRKDETSPLNRSIVFSRPSANPDPGCLGAGSMEDGDQDGIAVGKMVGKGSEVTIWVVARELIRSTR